MLTTVLHFRTLFYKWHKNDKKEQKSGSFCHLIIFTKSSFFKEYPDVLKKAFVIMVL
jgi:hypothetical protein